MGRDCASEAFQSRWPRPIRGTPANASAEIDVAAVTVEGTLRQGLNGPARPIRRLVSRLPPSQAEGVRGLQRASRQDRERHLGAARCGGRVKSSTCVARNARAGGGGGRGRLRRLAEIAPGRRLSSAAKPRRPPRLAGFDRSPVDGSSKQLPTNQRDTDNAEKHEPNEIHPEDYGVCVAYDQSIAASTK
jgi:hypothetical protein